MSTIIGIIVAFIFFDWPERWLVLLGFLLFDFLEIYIWLRWRTTRSMTGPEGIIGDKGTALTNCSPKGQVRVKGQTWKAVAPEGVGAGEPVEVTGARGIQLEVRRSTAS